MWFYFFIQNCPPPLFFRYLSFLLLLLQIRQHKNATVRLGIVSTKANDFLMLWLAWSAY